MLSLFYVVLIACCILLSSTGDVLGGGLLYNKALIIIQYGCGEVLKTEDMEKHLKDQMPTHLMLVVEKFEQQIEMNTFMMAHFTEQMEEQVDKSMQLIQQTEMRQTATEAKLAEYMKMAKNQNQPMSGVFDSSHIDAQLLDIKTKLRSQKDSMDVCQPLFPRIIVNVV